MDLDQTGMKVLELSRRIRQKEFKKRTLGKCTFNLSEKMKIGFSFFNLLQKVGNPPTKFVNAKNNKQLESITKHTCKTTASELYEN